MPQTWRQYVESDVFLTRLIALTMVPTKRSLEDPDINKTPHFKSKESDDSLHSFTSPDHDDLSRLLMEFDDLDKDIFDLAHDFTAEHGTGATTPMSEKLEISEKANIETVAALKREMIDNSRLIGTFSVLKSTYIKLCTEFNFLLSKFRQNEEVKMKLISENNELRKLLHDVIKERELDRAKYRHELSRK